MKTKTNNKIYKVIKLGRKIVKIFRDVELEATNDTKLKIEIAKATMDSFNSSYF